MRLDDLAARIGARLAAGHPAREISAIRSLDTAGSIELAGLFERRYATPARSTAAGAVVTSPALSTYRPDQCAILLADDPRAAWSAALRLLHPRPAIAPPPIGIDPRAAIDPSAEVDARARIGPFCVVGSRAYIADGVAMHAGAHVGAGAVIGTAAILHPHAVVHDGCLVGARVWLGTGAVIGSPGFGLDDAGRLPHIGIVVLEADVTVGAHTCVDRGTIGETRVGAGAHLDNLIQVGHNAQIGRGAILCGQVGIAGGAVIGDFSVIGGQAGVNGHVTIGARARIAAQAGVTKSLPGGADYSGHPAEPNRARLRRLARLQRLADANRTR